MSAPANLPARANNESFVSVLPKMEGPVGWAALVWDQVNNTRSPFVICFRFGSPMAGSTSGGLAEEVRCKPSCRNLCGLPVLSLAKDCRSRQTSRFPQVIGHPRRDLLFPDPGRTLNPHKGLLAEHVVEPQPEDSHRSRSDEEGAEDAQVRAEAREQGVADGPEGNDIRSYVCDYGVHAEHDEEERPAPVALYVDNVIEQSQQQETPAARPQHHRAGPDMLDNREFKAPQPACYQACHT